MRIVHLAVVAVLLDLSFSALAEPSKEADQGRTKRGRGAKHQAIDKQIGQFRFKQVNPASKAKSRSAEQGWIKKALGEEATVEYLSEDEDAVEVVIQRFTLPEFLAHEVEGELWNAPKSLDCSIEVHNELPVLVFRKKQKWIRVVWCYADLVVRITRQGAEFPDEIVASYLKKLPSELRKDGIYKNREQWDETDKKFKAKIPGW